MMLAPHSARRRDAQNERDGAGLRCSVAAATPSQLRRSSAARSISSVAAASAPSQQHQLRRSSISSVAAASAPSRTRRAE